MTSAAWQDRGDPLPGVRPAAASSGRRLAPVVYDLLKERLLEGEFQAGERLPVEALRVEFGVSKQPVMEALRRLSSEGLVEIIPQVGCRVPVYSGADVSDFFAIFGGMEGAVAGVAAQRCTDAQIDQLSAANGEIRRLIDEPDPAARSRGYLVLNRRFHGIIQDMARTAKFPVPVASAALQMFLMTAASGMGRDDDASVARMYARVTGTALPGEPKQK